MNNNTNDYIQRTIVNPDGSTTAVRVNFENITPEIAKKYLARNAENNRTINESRLIGYTRDMRSGDWWFTGNTIVFNDRGELSDGQYRMTSIVRSNKPQVFLVVRGITEKSMLAIDKGKSRSLLDSLKIAEDDTPLCTSRMVSLVKSVMYNGIKANAHQYTSDSEVIRLYNAFSSEFNTIYRIFPTQRESGVCASSAAALFAAYLNGVGQEVIAEYLKVFMNWERSYKYNDDAALTWHKQIVSLANKGIRFNQAFLYYGFQNSIYFFVTGKKYYMPSKTIERYPIKEMVNKRLADDGDSN